LVILSSGLLHQEDTWQVSSRAEILVFSVLMCEYRG
jgi:hypothetical protein